MGKQCFVNWNFEGCYECAAAIRIIHFHGGIALLMAGAPACIFQILILIYTLVHRKKNNNNNKEKT